MTLRRKNMVSHINAVLAYGFILLFGFVIFLYEVPQLNALHLVIGLANVAAMLRMWAGLNKYLIWGVMAAIMHFARPTLSPVAPTFDMWQWRWICINALSVLGMLMMVVHKTSSNNNRSLLF